jgi:Cytochrome bd terminal oxidase subunit I
MDTTALILSRLQFAFTISFHIIFPAFTIGLAAWLTILEALDLTTGRPAYRVLFEFWLKIFGVAFGLGVVSGVVMAFQFGTNWNVLPSSLPSRNRQRRSPVLHSCFGERVFCLSADAVLHCDKLQRV